MTTPTPTRTPTPATRQHPHPLPDKPAPKTYADATGFTPYISKIDRKRAQRATRHIPYAETKIVATARRTIFLRTASTPPPTARMTAVNIALAQAGAPAHVCTIPHNRIRR